MILISDVTCNDCGGPVTLFLIPDKVWTGLGLTTEWVCLTCVARRLNPNITADDLSEEIYKQRRRFKLKRINRYKGIRMETTAVVIGRPGEGLGPSMTAEEAGS
jgi:hypothetical protein